MNPEQLPDDLRVPASDRGQPDGMARRRSLADRTWRWMLLGSLAALIAVVSFGGGMIAERVFFAGGDLFQRARQIGSLRTDASIDTAAAFPRYAETKALLENEYFFRPEDPSQIATFESELEQDAVDGMATAAATPVATLDEYRQQLDFAAARGMTSALADDYTVFLEPIEQAPLNEALQGAYEGIGVWVDHPDGKFTVVAPIPGSPADEAGLRSRDVILAADGLELTGMDGDQALGLIRGPAGTSVDLRIARDDAPESFVVTVERRSIDLPSVAFETLADGRVAHISIVIFGDNTTPQLDEALRQAKAAGVLGIVLDLRGNGGGWVASARETIGRFVPESRGPALYEDTALDDQNALEAQTIVGGGEEVFDLPMAVLVDGSSASASEIVAGALRDYGRAPLMGEATFGKGLVQRVHDFADGSSARITFARWLTPNMDPIPDDGLQPDIVVPLPTTANVGDLQLQAAVDLVLKSAGVPPVDWASPVPGSPVAGEATPAVTLTTPAATPAP